VGGIAASAHLPLGLMKVGPDTSLGPMTLPWRHKAGYSYWSDPFPSAYPPAHNSPAMIRSEAFRSRARVALLCIMAGWR
jgi:hypothetical protein